MDTLLTDEGGKKNKDSTSADKEKEDKNQVSTPSKEQGSGVPENEDKKQVSTPSEDKGSGAPENEGYVHRRHRCVIGEKD